jgi:hypothetical protein
MPKPTAWTGWLKPPGKRQKWQPVVNGTTWDETWEKLLVYAGQGDKVVLKAGARPEANHNLPRRATR